MSAKTLTTVATDLIETYGNTARNVIGAYRAGNERVVVYLEQRWNSAFKQAASQLSEESRGNAQAAQNLFGGYYTKGVTLTANGAEKLVAQIVKLATGGLTQVAANASRFEEKTGLAALTQLSQVALPAAEKVTSLAMQLEQKTSELLVRIAGEKPAPVKAKRRAPVKKAARTVTRKAKAVVAEAEAAVEA